MIEYVIIVVAIVIFIVAFMITRPISVSKVNKGARDIITITAKKPIKKLFIKRAHLVVVRNNLKKGEKVEVVLPHSTNPVSISDGEGKINISV
ncbi:MAG: hypothetical protein QXY05_01350 [Candidatus Anstonellales archaeon]